MRATTRSMKDPAASGAYRGPVRLPTNDGLDNRSTIINLSATGSATSSGGGVLSGTVGNDTVTTLSEWANLANLYQEYRVLAIQLDYVPNSNMTYNAAKVPSVGAAAVLHVPITGAPTTLASQLENATFKYLKSGTPLRIAWKARNYEELGFVSTAGSVAHGGITWYVDGLTAATKYGELVSTFLVELRGRK